MTLRTRFLRLAWIMVALLALPRAAPAQSTPSGSEPAERATFLLHVNTDTMAIELATRTASGLSGEIVVRGQGARFVYRAELTRGSGISRLESALSRHGHGSDAAVGSPKRSGHRACARTFRDLNHLFVPHGGRGFDYSRLDSLSVQSSVLGEMTEWLLHSLLR